MHPAILRILRWSDLVALNNDGDITAPSWITWDVQGERLALGYESFVAILGSNPVLALKTSLPVRGSTGGVWNGEDLCVSGSDGITISHLPQEGYDSVHAHICTLARVLKRRAGERGAAD